MRGENPVLIGRSGPAHQFEGSKVGGDEAEAGDPGCHFAAGEEEVFRVLGEAFQVESNAQHNNEVQADDKEVDRRKVDHLAGHICCEQGKHIG